MFGTVASGPLVGLGVGGVKIGSSGKEGTSPGIVGPGVGGVGPGTVVASGVGG